MFRLGECKKLSDLTAEYLLQNIHGKIKNNLIKIGPSLPVRLGYHL